MRTNGVLAFALGLALLGPSASTMGWAARKYYPPGFKPPADQTLIPSATPVEAPPKTTVIIPQAPAGKQVIIKTVPVTVEKMVTVQAKPRDPLMILMEERRHFDALRLVDERLKKSPNNLSLQLFRAKILRAQGNYAKALEQYAAILDKNHAKNARADAQNGIGWTDYQRSLHERQMGNHGAANASLRAADMAFRQSAHLSPDSPQAWAGLGEVALANGQTQDADIWIRKAKKLGPNELAVQLADADLLLAHKKPDDALQVLYGIKKMTTREPDVYMLLARASLDTGKVDDAIINLKQLLELEPDHTEALKLLSQSYERKMKPEDAEIALEKAISLNPMDEKSVNALLKIYEQRREDDRSILVLKTLLKDHPGQAAYGQALLQRLANNGRWDEVYQEGVGIMADTITANRETGGLNPQDPNAAQHALAQKEGIVSLFARAVYQKGRGMLDRRPLLKESTVQKAQTFAQMNLEHESKVFGPFAGQSLQERLTLLLIDPVRPLPPLPANLRPQSQDLPTAIQIAFLQGDAVRHDQWVSQVKDQVKELNPLNVASLLYDLGDYQGAAALVEPYLAQHRDDSNAQLLKDKIAADRHALQEHIDILGMLPHRIPDGYWQKTACEVLELGAADSKAHAVVGTALEKRHHPELALIQMQLAAKYAATQKDREYWTRRADKAARNLART
jgi:tetratricopeptide (TPR) repeat protein